MLPNYGDARQSAWCVHCGGATQNTDHIISKVLLDTPVPSDCPHIAICEPCNSGFSLDEEYVACLIECSRFGSVEKIERLKIRDALAHSPALAKRLADARIEEGNLVVFKVEMSRMRNVLLKITPGLALFELNESKMEEPQVIGFSPLHILTERDRGMFEDVPSATVFPEVGSRASQRIVYTSPGFDLAGWIIVQPDRFRYTVTWENTLRVRMVLSEYLACEVVWE